MWRLWVPRFTILTQIWMPVGSPPFGVKKMKANIYSLNEGYINSLNEGYIIALMKAILYA